MDYLKIIPAILLTFFFKGCGQCVPEVKQVYLKTDVPRLKTLYKVEPFKITQLWDLDDKYYKVSKAQLNEASRVSQKRIHNINFYELQNNEFNRRFHKKFQEKKK